MKKIYLYFQPEYVDKFKCDGTNCSDNCCCRDWKILIDKNTYAEYSRLGLKEITRHIKFDEKSGEYIVTLNEKKCCPFLTEKNLCRIQLEHGENFLSLVCATYPRIIYDFGKFFEQSLLLTCPIAAEMILFEREPMKFELVEKLEDTTDRVGLTQIDFPEKFLPHVHNIQVAMISILQERNFSIDQRLIVLGFFLDKLDEISAGDLDEDALTKLLFAYESKNFLSQNAPMMIQSIHFDAKKFIRLTLEILKDFFNSIYLSDTKKFIDAVSDALQIKPDENNIISAITIADNYERLAGARKKFLAQYSTLLENFLVNEIFIDLYPWNFADSITKSFALFLTTYKVFELLIFSATMAGLDSRDDLLKLINLFVTRIDHNKPFRDKILEQFKDDDDIFTLMGCLLHGQ